MKKHVFLVLASFFLVSCGGNTNASYNNSGTLQGGGDNEPAQVGFRFSDYESNHDKSSLVNYLRNNGSTKQEYTEINGKYDYYDAYTLDKNAFVISYFIDSDYFSIVIRHNSDIAIAVFKFQAFNSTNNGMLTSSNGATYTQKATVENHVGKTAHTWINEGIRDINQFCCENASVTLTD